ncbi:hypothetical protein P301_J10621 [Saccharomyces cerevisiae P301]|uniref:Putative uncharacterized protein YJL127W-A n=2 Tax=Saccharomyces cerevisiae TaxID=4932 RepID=YJ27A_YEAST|nr:RecName: Full=Putative uncharacterized protein YJL127W-A [Saccharomyces cerevisiae S288C]EWG85008.1 hypothetical protein R008_J10611 [Saccharomyces cerevisiae R008]EWG90290.1 hypothetical protein P301_J10621 [Saccharomyces cerevisiae P301]EWG95231.1 hypothetical protein R103_J20011 [Saccharomyces cerevisiae R103]KZV10148.1 hypothetical protein WN66_03434 [Saccharomyces cerevisiae]WNV73274.1 hypothetical protein O6U65_1175 [Saccharomyces cerevisiae synthetic construct]CAY80603.1 EC1118_1J11
MTLMSGEGQGKSSSVKRVPTIAATLVFFFSNSFLPASR